MQIQARLYLGPLDGLVVAVQYLDDELIYQRAGPAIREGDRFQLQEVRYVRYELVDYDEETGIARYRHAETRVEGGNRAR